MLPSNSCKTVGDLICERTEWTQEQLLQEFRRHMEITVESVRIMAADLHLLQKTGYDLAKIRSGVAYFILRIAEQVLLPEVFVRYYGHTRLLKKIAGLTPSEQARLADDRARIELLCVENGETTSRLVDPLDMSPPEVQQAFGPNGIRNLAEQRSWLQSKATPAAFGVIEDDEDEGDQPIVVKIGTRKGIHVKQPMFIPKKQLLSYLHAME